MEEGGETAQSPRNGCQSFSQLCPSMPGSALAARLDPLGKLLWKTEGEGVKNPERGTPALGKLWTASTGPYPTPAPLPRYRVLFTPGNASMCEFYFCIHMLR